MRTTLLSLLSAPLKRFVIERPAQISLPVISLLSRMISRRPINQSFGTRIMVAEYMIGCPSAKTSERVPGIKSKARPLYLDPLQVQ